MSRSSRPSLLARLRAAFAILVALSSVHASAGDGKWRVDGAARRFDFCVSLRWDATPAEVAIVQYGLLKANFRLADATDGACTLGRIGIANNKAFGREAEVWVHPGHGRAHATLDGYGKPKLHANLYFNSNFLELHGREGDALTVVHELGHLVWRLGDEYRRVGDSDGECEPMPGDSTTTYSLMDNYFLRGGRINSPEEYTLDEWCVAANHDPDADSGQTRLNGGLSCWESVASHRLRPLAAPVGLPIQDPSAAPDPVFVGLGGTELRRVALCVARGASMGLVASGAGGATKLALAKRGAGILARGSRVGDMLGVASFADLASIDMVETPVTGSAEIATALAAIDGWSAGGGRATGLGLATARDMLAGAGDPSCANTLVLVADGPADTGPSEQSVGASIASSGASVVAVGVGADGHGVLVPLVEATGGEYHHARTASLLPSTLARVGASANGQAELAHVEERISNGMSRTHQVWVDGTPSLLRFVLTWPDAAQDLDFSIAPPGTTLAGGAIGGASACEELVEGPGFAIWTWRGAPCIQQGLWAASVQGASVVGGPTSYQISVQSDEVGARLVAWPDKPTYAWPEAVVVRATLSFAGLPVVGGNVSGTLHKPDGTSANLVLRDDGSDTTLDDLAGDGTYAARIQDFGGPGIYVLEARAMASGASTWGGEALFASVGDPAAILTVPDLQRSTSTCFLVESAPSYGPLRCFEIEDLRANIFGLVLGSCSLDVGDGWAPASEPLTIAFVDPDTATRREWTVPAGGFTLRNAATGSWRWDSPAGEPDFHVAVSLHSRRLYFWSMPFSALTGFDGPELRVEVRTGTRQGEAVIPWAPWSSVAPVYYSYHDPAHEGCVPRVGPVPR
ncbi:MAG: hypothetical protein RL112_767 [Planctomycetota bacterium]